MISDEIANIDTPAVLLDLDVASRNITRFQSYANQIGMAVRPHIKTHKLPQIAALQLAAGAIGITCQKTSDAEAMVAADPRLTDVLITYNIVGTKKLAHLQDLARKVRLTVVADSSAVVAGLSAAFATQPSPLRVLVECNTGADRCGVATPEAAATLARQISDAPGLQFEGLMTYPPVNGATQVQAFMTKAKALIEANGLAVKVVSSGGTPSMMQAGQAP